MNENATLLILRVNAAIIAALLIGATYLQFNVWKEDQFDDPVDFSQQELLVRVDDLVKAGRPLGTLGHIGRDLKTSLTLARLTPPLTASERAALDYYLTAKGTDPVNIWDLKDASISYPARRTAGENVSSFVLEGLLAYLPAACLLFSLAFKSCIDSFRLWAYGGRYRLQPMTSGEACVFIATKGICLSLAGTVVVRLLTYDQPALVSQAAVFNPLLCFVLFSIYRNCLLTRVIDSTTLQASTWWFVY